MNFERTLRERIAKTGSHLCVGLDPRPDQIAGDVFDFLRRVIDDVADATAAFKPNIAYFEAMGVEGYRMLEKTLEHIPDGVPVILDVKRSDIPETQGYYARAYFEGWDVDAVTLNPYLGYDSCEPFFRYEGKGVYLLAVTSNAGAAEFQLKMNGHDHYIFEETVGMIARAATLPTTVGCVLGLTNIQDAVLERIPDVPLLIPGFGPQGGDLRRLAAPREPAPRRRAPIVVNASRGILYASDDRTFRERAAQCREMINDVLT